MMKRGPKNWRRVLPPILTILIVFHFCGCDADSGTSTSSGSGGCDTVPSGSSSSTSSSSSSSNSSSGSTTGYSDNWPLTGDLVTHDVTIIKEGSTYYLFGTQVGPLMKRSHDGLAWSDVGKVFSSYPSWFSTYVPGYHDYIWAPDISYYNGKYYLYYAVSTPGRNTSAIGLATTTTLSSPNWQDQGMVIHSVSYNDYNCIDPNMVVDQAGQPWLAFGSWWSGLKLVKLNTGTMKPQSGATLYSLATRDNDAIENPSIVYRNGYYYLFASIDHCCKGVDSDYKIIYGRATSITGPYYDKTGKKLIDGGGTIFDAGNARWAGPGGQALLGTYAIAHHAYDVEDDGHSKVLIKNLYWDADGWPYKGDDVVNGTPGDTSVTINSTFNGTYAMVANHSGKALDVWEWGTTNGTNIAQYDYWGGNSQLFTITPVDRGFWHRITPVIATGQSFDIASGSTSAGANLQTYTYWGAEFQQFRFESAGSGQWRIIARHSGMCLDVLNSSTDNGANVRQYDCLSGAANQSFKLR